MGSANNHEHPQIRPDQRDYAIYALDASGVVTSWNEACERINGYQAGEIIGQHFSIFYPPEKRAEGYPDKVLSMAASAGFWIDDGWRVRKDGTQFWAHVLITAQRDRENELTGFIKITRDDTMQQAGDDEGPSA